jgi:hypothetical protein
MSAKKTLTAENLAKLGSRRLADLLLDVAGGDERVKRRLRLELAAEAAPARLAAEVSKRLANLGRARSFIERYGAPALARELDSHRRLIVDRVAKADAAEALDLMWRFMELAEAVHERADDSDGALSDVFATACSDLGTLARAAKPDPLALADRTFAALQANDYGQYDGLIETLAASLAKQGLERLKAHLTELSKMPVERPRQEEREIVGWGMNGPLHRDEIEKSARQSRVRQALQDIADIQGDVDAFIAQYDEKTRKVPAIAAEIARRLLSAGRAKQALKMLQVATRHDDDRPEWHWENALVDTLEALGHEDRAQAVRWSCFERALSAQHLRAYLERLPDFDDVEAEERALAHVERSGHLLQALSFLVSWPALDRAAGLVVRRAGELDGDHYEVLGPAAEALAGKFPLAATLILRAMVDFALCKSRSARYRHAARHLMDCSGLASSIADWGAFETHEAYASRLEAEHRRKSAFWSLLP